MECKEIQVIIGTIEATPARHIRSPQQYSTVKCSRCVYLDLEQKLLDQFCKIFHKTIFGP